jgi:hypothetical protein
MKPEDSWQNSSPAIAQIHGKYFLGRGRFTAGIRTPNNIDEHK